MALCGTAWPVAACATAAPASPSRNQPPRSAAGPRAGPLVVVPDTARDPLPYTPPPSTRSRPGQPVGLSASGGEDQARRLMPEFLRAVRAADEDRLMELLYDEVAHLDRSRARRRARPRSSLVRRILLYARRHPLPTDVAVRDLVDLSQLEVRPARERWSDGNLPSPLRGTDLLVSMPVREAGRLPLRFMLGWGLRGALVVRPGRPPRIVAL